MDNVMSGIGRGESRATIRPDLKVVESIDDAAAKFAIDWSGAVGAMLLQGATGQTQEARGLGRAKIAWRGFESRC